MGQPKALLPWNGVPLVRHQVDLLAARPAVDHLIVVVGSLEDQVRSALDGTAARIVVNPRFREGRATSLSAAARALRDLCETPAVLEGASLAPSPGGEGWGEGSSGQPPPGYAKVALRDSPTSVLVVNVDQPLASDLLDPLLAAWCTHPDALWRPSYHGRGGHPLIVPADVTPELAHVTEAAQGLRAVVARHRRRLRSAPVNSQLAVLNLNTPADYAAAQPFGGPAPSPKLSAGP